MVVTGGAGGKGTWGKPGQEQDEEGNAMDSHDPNYDSDSLVCTTVLFCFAFRISAKQVKTKKSCFLDLILHLLLLVLT